MIKCLKSWIQFPFLLAMQDKKIFRPWKATVQPMLNPKEYGLLNTQEIFLENNGEKIQIWASNIDMDKIIICFHGNTGHWGDVGEKERGDPHFFRDYRIHLLKALTNAGFGWYAVSVRGYGGSSRIPVSEKTILDDVYYLTEWFSKLNSNNKIIVLGESLGSFAALNFYKQLQTKNINPEICALIAPFISITKRASEILPCIPKNVFEKTIKHKLNNEETIRNLKANSKLTIFHPEKDRTTPFEHGKYLSEVAKQNGLNSRLIPLPNVEHLTWIPEEIAELLNQSLN